MNAKPAPARSTTLSKPLMALVLGIAPFWVFVGMDHFGGAPGGRENLLGVMMAMIGLLACVRMLRGDGKDAPRWMPRTMLLVVALLVCAFQLGHSAGLYSARELWHSVAGRPAPEPSNYTGLPQYQVHSTESASRQRSEAELRADIATSYALIRGQTQARNLYVAACYPAMAPMPLPEPPAFLREDDRKKIEDYEQAMIRAAERRCTEANTLAYISRKQEEIARMRDIAAIQERIYAERNGG
ncbi:hypothetical protein HMPREF9946_04270 [Acetobacteraceae bacterium AT-5844]|nr:hypothetical protein HMPREF9946_04270 [Acetobacteraceae bacterium AT-5844]